MWLPVSPTVSVRGLFGLGVLSHSRHTSRGFADLKDHLYFSINQNASSGETIVTLEKMLGKEIYFRCDKYQKATDYQSPFRYAKEVHKWDFHNQYY